MGPFSGDIRSIPASKYLVTPSYKPFRPFGRGPTTRSLGDLLTMLTNPLGWSSGSTLKLWWCVTGRAITKEQTKASQDEGTIGGFCSEGMDLKQSPNPTKHALSKKAADDMHIHGSFENLHVVSYVYECLLLLILIGCFFCASWEGSTIGYCWNVWISVWRQKQRWAMLHLG